MEVYLAPAAASIPEQCKSGTQNGALHLSGLDALPLDEINKAMVVRRHPGPWLKRHPLCQSCSSSFRAIYNHARRTCSVGQCPTTAIVVEDKPDGRIIDDLKDWRLTIADLDNPIHRHVL
jgi:hypothetical protein